MIKQPNILLTEIINLFECQVLLRSETSYNKVDIFNQIRAVSGVVVVNIVSNDYLESKRTKDYEYSLLKVKYIVNKSPIDDIKALGIKMLKGDGEQIPKIDGIVSFLPRLKTIRKVGK